MEKRRGHLSVSPKKQTGVGSCSEQSSMYEGLDSGEALSVAHWAKFSDLDGRVWGRHCWSEEWKGGLSLGVETFVPFALWAARCRWKSRREK